MKEEIHRFCPQCSSTNLKWYMGGRLGDQYQCMKCGYIGPALAGTKEFIEKARKKI